MKYLKKFNESINYHDVAKYIEEHIPYLLDDGFEVDVFERDGDDQTDLDIRIIDNDIFSWDDVRDHIIPILEILYSEYNYYIEFHIRSEEESRIENKIIEQEELPNLFEDIYESLDKISVISIIISSRK